ncbi:MAG: hypothetical protein CVT95_13520 [Bacteroidetes bacterium HGW-Bacteroidetes-12]|nr:MAG: hypothetical protein CVT95_13520 [Bacteroidetes bacterium HGW-Bacteroidetes-12]
MDKENILSISVSICGRKFHLNIKPDEEENIRKTAEEINKQVKLYANKYAYKDMQDLLSMVALQYATKAINTEDENLFIQNKLQDRLVEINKALAESL